MEVSPGADRDCGRGGRHGDDRLELERGTVKHEHEPSQTQIQYGATQRRARIANRAWTNSNAKATASLIARSLSTRSRSVR
jgi:hypothetical protein